MKAQILSPILFTIYINNLPKYINKIKKKIMFADDIVLYFAEENIKNVEMICFQNLTLSVQIFKELQLSVNTKTT